MRIFILAAGAALTLSACGGGSTTENSEANMMAGDNMMVTDPNMMGTDMNAGMGMDANMGGGMDANMATNSATESNMMAQDQNTNDPDSNLANGM